MNFNKKGHTQSEIINQQDKADKDDKGAPITNLDEITNSETKIMALSQRDQRQKLQDAFDRAKKAEAGAIRPNYKS